MPLHNEVPSLWKIASKKVANLLIDSVKYMTKDFNSYKRFRDCDKEACMKKVFKLQQLLFCKFDTRVHNVYEEVEIQTQHHHLDNVSLWVLFAVLIRSDMKVFNSQEPICVKNHYYLLNDVTFWKSRLEQCHCLVELDVIGLDSDFVAKCNYFQVISNNCKDTLKKVSFCYRSCEETLPSLNNLRKCKELTSVNCFCDNDKRGFDVSSQYAICVKMFVESLPKLSTLFLPDMFFLLEKYDELDILGFSSTSLTGFGKYIFRRKLRLLRKLFSLCPNIEQISLCQPFKCSVRIPDSDAVIMKCLNSGALHLQSLSVTLLSDNFCNNITQLTTIGANLRTLKLNISFMTASDFFVLGQVCYNLELLSVEVQKFLPHDPTFSVARLTEQAVTSGMFTKLKSLSIILTNVAFYSYEELTFTMDLKILTLILNNAKNIEELDLRSTFNYAFDVMIPFFQDGTLENLKRFTYRAACSYIPLTKDTMRLMLDQCPKLSFLKLMAFFKDNAFEFLRGYCNEITAKNLVLETEVWNENENELVML